MKRLKVTLIVIIAEIVVIGVLHFVLLRWCADGDVVSKALFSPGGHTARTDILLTVGFLLVRFLAVLVLPGIVLERAGRILMLYWSDERTS